MTHPALIERITRSLAYMLRHQPEQFDLELDEYGFGELDDVVQALNERLGEAVEEEDVHAAVTSGDRVRYEIDGGRIRALYGHSIEVKPGEPSKPPPLLYVGVSSADAERARRYGLRAGRRRFLHLALTPEDALETGRRSARNYVVITVNALDAWEEGINFYDRKSLFLSDPIPTHFLEVGDMHSDGYGEEVPDRRDGGRRDGGHREERHPQDRQARYSDRGSHSGSRAPVIAPREAFVEREAEVVHGDDIPPGYPVEDVASSRAAPEAGHETGPREPGGRRRRRRGGRRHDETPAFEGQPRGPSDSTYAPRQGQDERRDPPRAAEAARGSAPDLRERPIRPQEPRGPREGGRHEFPRPPSGDRPRNFEPRHEERRGGRGHSDELQPRTPPSPAHTPPARPLDRAPTTQPGDFGTGIFEPRTAARPQRERAPAPPPREREREPREAPRQQKAEKPDDTGFGAGI